MEGTNCRVAYQGLWELGTKDTVCPVPFRPFAFMRAWLLERRGNDPATKCAALLLGHGRLTNSPMSHHRRMAWRGPPFVSNALGRSVWV
jgi:hypothetical protein